MIEPTSSLDLQGAISSRLPTKTYKHDDMFRNENGIKQYGAMSPRDDNRYINLTTQHGRDIYRARKQTTRTHPSKQKQLTYY